MMSFTLKFLFVKQIIGIHFCANHFVVGIVLLDYKMVDTNLFANRNDLFYVDYIPVFKFGCDSFVLRLNLFQMNEFYSVGVSADYVTAVTAAKVTPARVKLKINLCRRAFNQLL